jgi:hypothetical protein
MTGNSKRGREIHRIPDGARKEHVSRRFGGTEGKGSEDFYGAAGFAKSEGIWRGGAAEPFAGSFSEGIEGGGRSESDGRRESRYFDSADGGIAGATLAEIQRNAKGEVSRKAFWTQSYLDSVEAFWGTGQP